MRYLLLILLTGCATVNEGVQIMWHKTTNPAVDCANVHGKVSSDTSGCYVWRQTVCHVYAPDPPIPIQNAAGYHRLQWSTLGHEIKHCFDGNFHK